MEIKYEFVDSEVSVVEVDDEIGAVIADSRRKEENLERNNRRHCYSIDALEYGDKDIYAQSTDATPEMINVHKEESGELYTAFSRLSETQQRRLLMLASGMSMRQIAECEDVDIKTVRESIEGGRKKFKKFFKIPPQNS
ncbi:MAG: hypothetical protein ACI4C7_02880 [Clostridia bacterium]